jgi:hypothetical protein
MKISLIYGHIKTDLAGAENTNQALNNPAGGISEKA